MYVYLVGLYERYVSLAWWRNGQGLVRFFGDSSNAKQDSIVSKCIGRWRRKRSYAWQGFCNNGICGGYWLGDPGTGLALYHGLCGGYWLETLGVGLFQWYMREIGGHVPVLQEFENLVVVVEFSFSWCLD